MSCDILLPESERLQLVPTTVTLKPGSAWVLQDPCKDAPTTDSQIRKQSLLLPPRVTCSLLLPHTSKELGTLWGSVKMSQHNHTAMEIKDLALEHSSVPPSSSGCSLCSKNCKIRLDLFGSEMIWRQQGTEGSWSHQDVCEPWEPARDAEGYQI